MDYEEAGLRDPGLVGQAAGQSRPRLTLGTVVELLKPITWFAPMWAFGCGVVSSGRSVVDEWPVAIVGMILCGPLVCGTSQAANDWYDRHVDAINEPLRPIPSGRLPGRSGLLIALGWTVVSIVVATTLGPWAFSAAIAGLALAWMYSAPPFRLKQNGWLGNLAVAVSYEGLPWITGAAVLAAGMPNGRILGIAALYSAGAHGIMTLNDFKSVDGDRRMGIRSLPVRLGIDLASRLACLVMAVPQAVVVLLLSDWGHPVQAICVALLLVTQLVLMARFLDAPRERAPWYNATGTGLYVLGMLITAFALQTTIAGQS